MSLQFHVVFDDKFTLVPAMRSRTVPANWADLVSKSSESVSNSSVDTSKVWFNQMHSDPDDPASGLDALIPTVTNVIESNLPAQAPEAINITETPPPYYLQRVKLHCKSCQLLREIGIMM